jgi:WD40 repeat protein
VRGVAFSKDGSIVSASWDGTVKLWNEDAKSPITLKGHNAPVSTVTFSKDGQMIASASWDGTVKLWLPDGTLLKTLGGHKGPVWGASFSPDGTRLASASEDRTIILWNVKDILERDELEEACKWVDNYLKHNDDVSEADRRLCDD